MGHSSVLASLVCSLDGVCSLHSLIAGFFCKQKPHQVAISTVLALAPPPLFTLGRVQQVLLRA